MKNAAALICIAVCSVSVGINTIQGKYVLAVIYVAGIWLFWRMFED
jgi:hypothetical protein